MASVELESIYCVVLDLLASLYCLRFARTNLQTGIHIHTEVQMSCDYLSIVESPCN